MLTRLRYRLAIVVSSVITVLGFATGIALGCNNCASSVTGCTPLYESVLNTCCVDLDDDGVKHCSNCWRDKYICANGPALGPPYACSGAGSLCS